MIDFFDIITKYWAVITWVVGMIFTMGVMWMKIETSQRAFRILFEKTDKFQTFMDGQEVQNDSFKETMEGYARAAREHREDDNRKFGEITGRLDQIFALQVRGHEK